VGLGLLVSPFSNRILKAQKNLAQKKKKKEKKMIGLGNGLEKKGKGREEAG
jgi:hypothetical protein